MKLLPLLLAAFAFFAGSVRALEITYSQTITKVPASGGVSVDAYFPFFDVALPEIPDDAVLERVRVVITQTISAVISVFASPGQAVTLAPVITSSFWLPTLAQLSASESYTTAGQISSFGTFTSGYNAFFQMESSTDVGRNKYLPSLGAGGVALSGTTVFSPGATAPVGAFVVSDLGVIQSTYSVTYTYGVPDGGSTMPLLLVGLLSCRWIAFRRWTVSRW